MLRLQKLSNRLGQSARRVIESIRPADPHRFSHGLNTCAVLFCAAPLGIVGAIQDGLPVESGGLGYFYPLALKALMDGLAMTGFVRMFGWGAMVSALPVFVFQGTITMACHIYLEPFLRGHGLLESVNAVGGLVVCTVGVVIFEIRRVELADYLPSLAVARSSHGCGNREPSRTALPSIDESIRSCPFVCLIALNSRRWPLGGGILGNQPRTATASKLRPAAPSPTRRICYFLTPNSRHAFSAWRFSISRFK